MTEHCQNEFTPPNESNELFDAPPEVEVPLAITDPKACFDKFFWFRGITDKVKAEAFLVLMEHKYGIHLFLMGSFWDVKEIDATLSAFEEFVIVHNIPVKVTWLPRHPGGPNGMYCFLTDVSNCSLVWKDGMPQLSDFPLQC